MAVVLGTNAGFVTTAPTSDPDGTGVVVDDVAKCHKDVCPSGVGIITEIGWYNSVAIAENTFDLGLYSHDSGGDTADALLNSSIGNAPQGLGWNVITGLSWSVTPTTTYWIAIQQDIHDGSSGIDTNSTGGRDGVVIGATSLPNPFNSSSDGTRILALYAKVEALTTFSELSGTIAVTTTVTGNMVLGTIVELAGTIAATTTVTGNMVLSTVSELSGTIAAVSTVGPSSLGSTTVDIDQPTATIKRLVSAGNNQIFYENI